MKKLDELLAEVDELTTSCQELPGPSIETKSKFYVGDPDEYELSEQVPTLNEYLRLLKVVESMLELMGAQKT